MRDGRNGIARLAEDTMSNDEAAWLVIFLGPFCFVIAVAALVELARYILRSDR